MKSCITIAFLFSFILVFCNTSCRSKQILESQLFQNSSFGIRVTSYKERNLFPVLAGAWYVFESTTPEINNWNEFMEFRQDDPVGFNSDSVKFLNSQVAYVYIGWKFAVTTNAGKNWIVWDGSLKDLPGRINYRLIDSVSILEDGTGEMYLKFLYPEHSIQKLVTKDFGKTWDGNISGSNQRF